MIVFHQSLGLLFLSSTFRFKLTTFDLFRQSISVSALANRFRPREIGHLESFRFL